MITLSPAGEARELLRDCLRQIAVHSAVSFVRQAADKALQDTTQAAALYVIRLSVQCRYRNRLVQAFQNCSEAGGFDDHH